jgi:dienelactone hydrolase
MSSEQHPCCDSTSPSPIWDGKPTGKVIDIEGIEAYVAQGSQNQNDHDKSPRVILHLTEGHSMYFINAQLLADSFASNLKCDVIMPDQFAGKERVPKGSVPNFPEGKKEILVGSQHTPPPHFLSQNDPDHFELWKKSVEPAVTDPIIARVVKYIHETYGEDVRIGGVGYCFGGRYVMRLMGSGIIDVGVVNHPSFFTMEEIENLGKGKKLAMYAAEIDDILPAEKRRATEDILTKFGTTWTSTVFSGTQHGFSVRGDLSVKEVRIAKEKAFKGAVEWFIDWL